jgi:ABC-type molybdate transport system substrate-binding protein
VRDGAQVEGIALPPVDSLRDEVSYAVGVLKGSKRSAAAASYLDFLATPQAQAVYAGFGFVGASNAELKLKPIP